MRDIIEVRCPVCRIADVRCTMAENPEDATNPVWGIEAMECECQESELVDARRYARAIDRLALSAWRGLQGREGIKAACRKVGLGYTDRRTGEAWTPGKEA